MIQEYPTYGVYKDQNLTEKQIYQDSLNMYDFAVNVLKFDPKNIIIFGRSIGSGPAVYLASKVDAHCLILFSPFLSVKDVARDKVGVFSLFKS